MDEYRHRVSGFFAHRAEAENAFATLVARGLPPEQLQLFGANSAPPANEPAGDNNEVLKDVLIDGAVGTAVGTGIGALAEVALVAANVTLFIASPLVAPLAMLGWGASLGALVGAVAGARTDVKAKEGWFSDLVQDAITTGQVVLVAETRSEPQTALARKVLEVAVGDYSDISAP